MARPLVLFVSLPVMRREPGQLACSREEAESEEEESDEDEMATGIAGVRVE